MLFFSIFVRFLHPIIYGKYPDNMVNIVGTRLPKFSEEQSQKTVISSSSNLMDCMVREWALFEIQIFLRGLDPLKQILWEASGDFKVISEWTVIFPGYIICCFISGKNKIESCSTSVFWKIMMWDIFKSLLSDLQARRGNFGGKSRHQCHLEHKIQQIWIHCYVIRI